MRTKQEYLDLLEETVAYYSEDVYRRAKNEYNGCMYYEEDTGNMCAVGRCLKDAKGIQEYYGNAGVSLDILDALKEEYKGFDIEMWESLQELHDCCNNWNDEGLSLTGQEKVEKIKKFIELIFE